MRAPFFEHGAFGEGTSLVVALGIGVAFGFFLERGGMGSARKLVGVFQRTDMAVIRVLFSALVTALLGVYWLTRTGLLDLPLLYLPSTWVLPQLVGGLLFGVGFSLGGLCPGTTCVAAATGRGDGWAAAAGMFCGTLLFNESFGFFEPFYRSTSLGVLSIPELVDLPFGVVVAGVVLFALVVFRAVGALESGR